MERVRPRVVTDRPASADFVPPAEVLVLGFGNVLLGDDGAGVRLMERLSVELDTGVAQFVYGGTMSFSLLSFVESARAMLIVDAADIHGPPGSFALYEDRAMDEFLSGFRRRTVHEAGLVDLMDIARMLRCVPEQRALLCIQPQRVDWSMTLSEPVENALAAAVKAVRALLRRWGEQP
jgi:hydrogenase maturation protease